MVWLDDFKDHIKLFIKGLGCLRGLAERSISLCIILKQKHQIGLDQKMRFVSHLKLCKHCL